ncbi:MAG: DinB family protein [Rhodothermales bacterium]
MMAPLSSAQLQTYCSQLKAAERHVRELAERLPVDQLRWKPGKGQWSIGECIEHLNLVGGSLLPRINESLNDARVNGPFGSGPFTLSMFEKMFLRSVEPGSRVSIPTPPLYRPRPIERIGPDSLHQFSELQQAFQAVVSLADGLDIAKIKVSSPVSRVIKLSVAAWFEVIIAHQERHLAQVEAVLQNDRFPG